MDIRRLYQLMTDKEQQAKRKLNQEQLHLKQLGEKLRERRRLVERARQNIRNFEASFFHRVKGPLTQRVLLEYKDEIRFLSDKVEELKSKAQEVVEELATQKERWLKARELYQEQVKKTHKYSYLDERLAQLRLEQELRHEELTQEDYPNVRKGVANYE